MILTYLSVTPDIKPDVNSYCPIYNDSVPFAYYPDQGWVDIKKESQKADLKIDFNVSDISNSMKVNENGLVAGIANLSNENILFLYSPDKGFRYINTPYRLDSLSLNNQNQVLLIGHEDQSDKILIYTEQDGFKLLNDLGIIKYTHGHEVEFNELTLSDQGIITGTFETFLSWPENYNWNFDDTSYTFAYFPNGTLYVSGLSEYEQHGKTYFDQEITDNSQLEEKALDAPFLFHTGKPITHGNQVFFSYNESAAGLWPIYKVDNQCKIKKIPLPKEFSKAQTFQIISKSIDSRGNLQVIGIDKDAEQREFKNYFLWNQQDGIKYLIDLIPSKWKTMLTQNTVEDFKTNRSGDIAFTVYGEDSSTTVLLQAK